MKQRGFTLLEMMIVIAVIGVVAAIAWPSASELTRRWRFNGEARTLVGMIRETRAVAVSRKEVAGRRTESAGIRIDAPTRYVLFTDIDTIDGNGNERDEQVVDLTDSDRSGSIHIASPTAGTILRFRRDGSTSAARLVLADRQSGMSRTVSITAGGQASLD